MAALPLPVATSRTVRAGAQVGSVGELLGDGNDQGCDLGEVAAGPGRLLFHFHSRQIGGRHGAHANPPPTSQHDRSCLMRGYCTTDRANLSSDDSIEKPTRRRRSDGERSRNAILREAARLATVEGIDGLSIGRLADAVGMSKSGLFAHFGSKEELQLATIDAASSVFDEQVVEPALSAPSALGALATASRELPPAPRGRRLPRRLLLRVGGRRDGHAPRPRA